MVLTLREGVRENRVLGRIVGPVRDGVTEMWKKLHNEELNDLYFTKYYLDDQIEKKEVVGACKVEER
jgi:hypothetical protein